MSMVSFSGTYPGTGTWWSIWNEVREGGHFEEVLGPHKLFGGSCVWAQIKEEIQLISMSTKKNLKIFVF